MATRDIRAGDEIIVDYGEVYFDRPSMAAVLYECGGVPALHAACGRGDLEVVRHLLRRRAPAQLTNQPSATILARTPLMHAALGASLAVATLLIQEGASLNSVDKEGRTALFLACERSAVLRSRGSEITYL